MSEEMIDWLAEYITNPAAVDELLEPYREDLDTTPDPWDDAA